jgi:hypothetical protein
MSDQTPHLTFQELAAAALTPSRWDQIRPMRRIEANVYPPVDPAVLERARQTMDDMKAGRVKGIPMEQVLDELDRMAEADWTPNSGPPKVPPLSPPNTQ